MNSSFRAGKLASFCIASTLLATLIGCAGFQTTATTIATPVSGGLSGAVHGGQQPVSASHIYLFEVGTSDYGSTSNNIINSSGSAGSDVYGNYILTAANGNFNLPGTQYTCTKPANQTYLLAYSGNPGLGGTVNNTAITLILALGNCGGIVSLPNVVINELSTVAAVTALQQFMTSPAAIGAPSTNKTGIVVASGLANDLIRSSSSTAANINQAGTGSIPQAKLNSLGNSLAPCINSTGPTSSACAALFTAATPSGGTAPTDVTAAMLLIAQNPNKNVAGIYALPTAAAPFQPSLSAQPNDWSLGISYSTPNLSAPQNIVIDANGAAWISNVGGSTPDALFAFSASGSLLTGTAGYTTGIHKPAGLAFDNAGNLWSTELASGSTPDQVVKMNGAAVTFAFNDSTLNSPYGIAIDAANNAWIVNQNTFSVDQILSGGTRTLAPVTNSNFYYPTGIAIDSNGFIFANGTGSNNILKLTAAGAYSDLYSNGNQDQPIGISIDGSDNLFTINNNSSLLTELNGTNGANVGGSPYMVSVSNATNVAVDGFATLWIADCQSCSVAGDTDNLLHVSAAGANIGSKAGIQDTNLVNPTVAAIDGSGNVWTTNAGSATVTEFLGVAGPVTTPLAVAVSTAKLGTRP